MRPQVLALALAVLAGPVHAEAVAPADPARMSPPATAAPARALSQQEMRQARGGQAEEISAVATQTLNASSSGNSITAQTVRSGDVTFSPDALSGFSGIGNFVINTGANNSLQGAINVSVVTAPLP
jgi:hypothetical protein